MLEIRVFGMGGGASNMNGVGGDSNRQTFSCRNPLVCPWEVRGPLTDMGIRSSFHIILLLCNGFYGFFAII